jgi:hypothetical protein
MVLGCFDKLNLGRILCRKRDQRLGSLPQRKWTHNLCVKRNLPPSHTQYLDQSEELWPYTALKAQQYGLCKRALKPVGGLASTKNLVLAS